MERAELKGLALAARQHVCDLAAGRKRWTMCIPIQDDDSDRLLVRAIDALLAEVQRLDGKLAQASAVCDWLDEDPRLGYFDMPDGREALALLDAFYDRQPAGEASHG